MSDAPSDPHATIPRASPRAMRSETTGGSEVASERLRQLLEALRPIIARLPLRPDGVEVTMGEGGIPHLRLDPSSFIDMTPNVRVYRLHHLGRKGSAIMAESGSLEGAIDFATATLSRRVVEGERRLKFGTIPFYPAVAAGQSSAEGPTERTRRAKRRALSAGPLYWIGQVFWFVVEVLGLLVLFGLAWMGLQA